MTTRTDVARPHRLLTALAALFVAFACAAPPNGTVTPASSGQTTENDARANGGAEIRVPDGPVPAAAPLTTFSADGERVDPIESLQTLLDDGDVVFSYDSVVGYLPSLLAALDIDVSSQNLVFSRTSLQAHAIAPWVPRALYFNDDVYIGYVVDSPLLEVASIDPDGGAVFYTMNQNPDQPPRFTHETTLCLGCHDAALTRDVPGVMTRSVLVGRLGYSAGTLHQGALTDRTPASERYLGWYVTGTHAPGAHAGNVAAPDLATDIEDKNRYLEGFDLNADGNVTSLVGRFDHSVYLSGHSDIVSLMVLTHQTRIHNLITEAQQDTRDALRIQEAAIRSTGQPAPESGLLPVTEIRVDELVEALIREMMFVNAAPIGGPVTGTSTFTVDFPARGPKDARGRSLRDLDLQDRLFRYPLSFLIYTEAFDALPALVKDRAYRRIDVILTGQDTTGDFEHLDAPTRAAIREILLETKPDFAESIVAGR